MPIDYSKRDPLWLSQVRPRIMKRANNTCEFEGCDFKHGETVWAVKYRGKTQAWYRDYDKAVLHEPKSFEWKNGKQVQNPKPIKVILTIAHLDHNEYDFNVSDDRLKAACQLCHLKYDSKEKYRRNLSKRK